MNNIEIKDIQRLICPDEIDLECNHCFGLTAYRFCEKHLIYCVHCGNPLFPNKCKHFKINKKAEVPRYSYNE